MRVSFPSGTRQAPTDRNPARIVQGGGAAQGGASTVNYVDYTVQANRRAEIRFARGWYVVTAALAAGQTESVHLDYINPVVNNVLIIQSIAAAPVNDKDRWEATQLFLSALDQIRIISTMTAGAGTVVSAGGISGIEYDV